MEYGFSFFLEYRYNLWYLLIAVVTYQFVGVSMCMDFSKNNLRI